MIRCTARSSSVASAASGSAAPSKYSTTGDGATGTSPRNTSPVPPSIESMSPSTTLVPSGAVIVLFATSTSSASAPHTQVLPMPRATTAAWLVRPPWLVRIPCAAIMPLRSSGFVSRRTRMTFSPLAARATAVVLSKTAAPVAAPGEAFMPTPSTVAPEPASNFGNISWASCSPVTRRRASSMSIRPSSTSWQATTNAAAAVRLPTRVCSIHSRPRSMVNSMSHMSR